eukprot:scaffold2697_cov346-Pavlova_lutheri.AAC.16
MISKDWDFFSTSTSARTTCVARLPRGAPTFPTRKVQFVPALARACIPPSFPSLVKCARVPRCFNVALLTSVLVFVLSTLGDPAPFFPVTNPNRSGFEPESFRFRTRTVGGKDKGVRHGQEK